MKIVGPYTSPTIYSENPGTVYLTSSDPSVASVEASVVVPGTRAWRNGLKHGQYLARANCLQNRIDCALFLELKIEDFLGEVGTIAYRTENILRNSKIETGNRDNYLIKYSPYNKNFRLQYYESATSATNTASKGTLIDVARSKLGDVKRFVIEMTSGMQILCYHTTGTAPDATLARTAGTAGTMGANEHFIIEAPMKFAKLDSLPSQAQREAFMASGTLPSGLAASYQGGHEIVETAPYFYDTSGNGLDLSDVDVTYWPEAAASGDYTDDPLDPVVPYQAFTVTPNSTGTFTITARRRRQGVPDRVPALPDAELWEETSETFTITEMPQEVVQYVRLLITTNMEGTVTITSSDPSVVTFPSSVVVGPTLQYEVLGTVVGPGTSTITTEMDGTVLATTTVTIEAEPTIVKCGPVQNVRSRI